MKLYKYRPLNELLFKELYYQEIYFSTLSGLNDPFDLNARIEFTPSGQNEIYFLVHLIFRRSLEVFFENPDEAKNNTDIRNFLNDKNQQEHFVIQLYSKLLDCKKSTFFISLDNLIEVVSSLSAKMGVKIDTRALASEIKRITAIFLENSSVTCFSEEYDNFLMWSHYSSNHSGVCLEFSFDTPQGFPFQKRPTKKQNMKTKEIIYFDKILPVSYQREQPHINFFDLVPILSSEYDVDVMHKSKNWVHCYAEKIVDCFSRKTLPWKYEKEWRAIQIDFRPNDPEDRIRHYSLERLTGIYFGLRTPENAKKRIINIFKSSKHDLKYFQCQPSNSRDLGVAEWEIDSIY